MLENDPLYAQLILKHSKTSLRTVQDFLDNSNIILRFMADNGIKHQDLSKFIDKFSDFSSYKDQLKSLIMKLDLILDLKLFCIKNASCKQLIPRVINILLCSDQSIPHDISKISKFFKPTAKFNRSATRSEYERYEKTCGEMVVKLSEILKCHKGLKQSANGEFFKFILIILSYCRSSQVQSKSDYAKIRTSALYTDFSNSPRYWEIYDEAKRQCSGRAKNDREHFIFSNLKLTTMHSVSISEHGAGVLTTSVILDIIDESNDSQASAITSGKNTKIKLMKEKMSQTSDNVKIRNMNFPLFSSSNLSVPGTKAVDEIILTTIDFYGDNHSQVDERGEMTIDGESYEISGYIQHSDSEVLPKVTAILSKFFDLCLMPMQDGSDESKKAKLLEISAFQWILEQAAPWERGTPTNTKMLVSAILLTHGFTPRYDCENNDMNCFLSFVCTFAEYAKTWPQYTPYADKTSEVHIPRSFDLSNSNSLVTRAIDRTHLEQVFRIAILRGNLEKLKRSVEEVLRISNINPLKDRLTLGVIDHQKNESSEQQPVLKLIKEAVLLAIKVEQKVEILNYLLDRYILSGSELDNILLSACEYKRLTAVELLLKRGVKPTAFSALLDTQGLESTSFPWKSGMRMEAQTTSPLIYAIRTSNPEMLKLLLKYCSPSDVNLCEQHVGKRFYQGKGESPLIIAAQIYIEQKNRLGEPSTIDSFLECIVRLIKKGANVTYISGNGKNFWTLLDGDKKTIEYIYEKTLKQAIKPEIPNHLQCNEYNHYAIALISGVKNGEKVFLLGNNPFSPGHQHLKSKLTAPGGQANYKFDKTLLDTAVNITALQTSVKLNELVPETKALQPFFTYNEILIPTTEPMCRSGDIPNLVVARSDEVFSRGAGMVFTTNKTVREILGVHHHIHLYHFELGEKIQTLVMKNSLANERKKALGYPENRKLSCFISPILIQAADITIMTVDVNGKEMPLCRYKGKEISQITGAAIACFLEKKRFVPEDVFPWAVRLEHGGLDEFFKAIERSDKDKIEELVKQGITCFRSNHPILAALDRGNLDLVEFLLELPIQSLERWEKSSSSDTMHEFVKNYYRKTHHLKTRHSNTSAKFWANPWVCPNEIIIKIIEKNKNSLNDSIVNTILVKAVHHGDVDIMEFLHKKGKLSHMLPLLKVAYEILQKKSVEYLLSKTPDPKDAAKELLNSTPNILKHISPSLKYINYHKHKYLLSEIIAEYLAIQKCLFEINPIRSERLMMLYKRLNTNNSSNRVRELCFILAKKHLPIGSAIPGQQKSGLTMVPYKRI